MKHIIKVADEDDDFFIPKGKWFYPCCEEDLQQSEGEEILYHLVGEYFDTKNEAIDSIKEMYERSRQHIGDKAVEEALERVEKLRA